MSPRSQPLCRAMTATSSWPPVLFVQGSSIELSADGPTRPPYAVYFQGGLTWYHAKLGILMSLQKMLEAGLISL